MRQRWSKWIWMGVMAACLAGMPACKRQSQAGPGTNAPVASRAARMAGPTSQDLANEDMAQLSEKYYGLQTLGAGTAYQAPDGESWVRFSSGVMIHELRPGSGLAPRVGQTVSVAYIGTLPNTGSVFDQSRTDKPLVFQMGSKDLIKGFSAGLLGMRPGGKRRVYLPAAWAYGDKGSPGKIPPNQDLIFELELLSVTGEAINIADELPPLEPIAPIEPMGPPAPATLPQ
jgi:FKBP-type peptidyl-prolyl cis-trans isomerase